MAKKWTTLRKIDDPQEQEADNDNSQPAARSKKETKRRSRVPRRLRTVREGLADPIIPEPVQAEPAEPETPEVEYTPPVRPIDIEEPRILVVHEVAATYRLIEETFGNFSKAKIDTTSDVLTAFELTILRDYQLFIVALELTEMSGTFFYELVSRVYKTGLGNARQAPAVVFVREPEDPAPPEDLTQDVRVKAVWSKPLNIEKMLDSVSEVIQINR